MRYFHYLSKEEREEIFYKKPSKFKRGDSKEILKYAVGSVLYCPATKEGLGHRILYGNLKGLMSLAICLEDAIGDKEVDKAEKMLLNHLEFIHNEIESGRKELEKIPMLFIRVREPEQISRVGELIKEYRYLITGVMLPKFSSENASDYLDNMSVINSYNDQRIYALPILESSEIIYKNTRYAELDKLVEELDNRSEYILNIRIGATDFSSLFGIRRSNNRSIYTIGVIADCIYDIINYFGRKDNKYVLSAPVYEYFSSGDRTMKPQLRETPFTDKLGDAGVLLRQKLIESNIDGILNEIELDLENGLLGKTIIHPSHIIPVQSLHVVSHEAYMDALSIIEKSNGEVGVSKSAYCNKMNEIKPHLEWAKGILKRAEIYGVYKEDKNFVDLLLK